MQSTTVRVLLRLAFVCLLAYYALGALALIRASVSMIGNRWENTYTESPTVYVATHAESSGRIYHSFSSPPYAPQPYGPLFYLLGAGIAKLSGQDIDLTFRHGRILSFSSYLLSGLVVLWITRRLGFSWLLSALAALMFWGQPVFIGWNVAVRPDMVCLLLMLLCLASALRAGDAPVWVLGSGVLAALAFLIKQTGASAPAAVGFVLLLERNWRGASLFALSAALPVFLVLGALLLHEPFFLEQFTSATKGPWSIPDAARFLFYRLFDITILIPIAVGAFGIAAALRANMRTRMVAYFAISSGAMALLTIPQRGGDTNYFFPTLAACALLAPFAVGVVAERIRTTAMIASIIAVLLCALPIEMNPRRHVASREVHARDDAYLPLRSLRVLSDTPFIALHGRDPELLDPHYMSALEGAGHWSSSVVAEKIRRGDYDLIVTACNRQFVCAYRGIAYFSPAVVQRINEDYEVLCEDSSAVVMKPRFAQPKVTPEMLDPILGERCGTDRRGQAPQLRFW